MTELVKRVDMVCYRGFQPKISCTMDPYIVAMGESLAKRLGLTPVPLSQLKIANGGPYHGHNGLDTVGRWNEKIYPIPCPKSKVKSVQHNDIRGHWLEYGNARVTVWQAHFAEINVVPGQVLTNDSVIGIEGASGRTTGKHLHTSIIIDGKYVDPYFYMTGQLKLPDEHPVEDHGAAKAEDGFNNWPVTDQWERSIAPKRYHVNTGGLQLLVRRSPGTDKAIVNRIPDKAVIEIDKLAELPDGQIWARLRNKPWNWICIKRGSVFATEVHQWPAMLKDDEWYFVRDTFEDVKSQTNAYRMLTYARKEKERTGKRIYHSSGIEVI